MSEEEKFDSATAKQVWLINKLILEGEDYIVDPFSVVKEECLTYYPAAQVVGHG